MNSDLQPSLFFLVPDLDPYGRAAAASILACHLARNGFRVAVGTLTPGEESVLADLKAAGVAIFPVSVNHSIVLGGAKRLKRAVREFAPSIIHAWGRSATEVVRHVVSRDHDGGNRPRLVVSASSETGGGIAGWLARRAIRRADRVVPITRADGERYRRLGVPVENLTLISPAAPARDPRIDRVALARELDLPAGARVLVAGGQSDRGVGPRDAIVAFDMIRFDAKDLYLVVCGAGEEEARLAQFGRSLAFDDYRLRFAPAGEKRAAVVRLADAVMVTHPRAVDEALEAMAAGKPVIGWHTPDLAEVVEEKVTGVLVPSGDRGALAACTRAILDNPSYARRLGEAGRTRSTDRFGWARMADQFSRLDRELVES